MNDNELLDYFKGLSIRDILQLARKSIVLTTENRELVHKIENIEEYCQDIINTSHVNDNDKYIAENIMQIIRGEN